LSERGLTGRVLESLHRIQSGGRRLLALIDDLLDLAKIEAGSLHIEALELDPARLIAAAVEPLRASAQAKGVEFQLGGDLPATIVGDRLRIGQIVTNLCDNAIKFTSQGRVWVTGSVRADGDQAWLQISVADTGCGIAPEHLPTLFTAFQQLDSSLQRERGGSGLGLALCRGLAQRMGGSIQVTSHPGVGSCFVLELPLRTSAAPGTDPTAEPRGRRLLLVEGRGDDPCPIAHGLRAAGASVDVVENGPLAVERALAGDYDAVLIDVEQPLLADLAATRALRDLGCRAPVLALTAHHSAEEREHCLAEGCDEVATKPVDWPSLFAQIAALCDRGSEKPGTL
jgi:CheY-like chemotaxis protein